MGAGAALYCGTLMLAGIKHGGDATIEVLGKVSLPLRCDTAPATDMPALMPEAAPALTPLPPPAQVLLTNTSLKKVVIRRSGLAAAGATALAAALRGHPNLSELDLMDNPEVSGLEDSVGKSQG